MLALHTAGVFFREHEVFIKYQNSVVEETSLPETLNVMIQIGPEFSFYYSG